MRPGLLGFLAFAGTAFLSKGAKAAGCGIVSLSPLVFGSYDSTSPLPVDSMALLGFSCDSGGSTAPLRIELSWGSGATGGSRGMRAGSFLLPYNLYLDAARTVVWGNGAFGSTVYSAMMPPLGVTTYIPIYGRVPGRQFVAPGLYTDTLVVTLYY